MTRRLFLILAAGFVFIALALPAQADIITFDENGNGTWTDLFGNVTPLTGFTAADPTGGITSRSGRSPTVRLSRVAGRPIPHRQDAPGEQQH